MFVIVAADGTIRKTFHDTPADIIALAYELRRIDDDDYTKRVAEAQRLVRE